MEIEYLAEILLHSALQVKRKAELGLADQPACISDFDSADDYDS